MNESGSAELIEAFLGNTQVFSRALANILEEEALQEAAETQLTATQITALRLIDQDECRTLSDLAGLLDVSPAAASKLVERLVRHKLIERKQNTQDRRETELSLNEAGRKLLERYREKKTTLLEQAFRECTPEELERAASLMARLSATILHHSRNPETCLQCYLYALQQCVARAGSRRGCRNQVRLKNGARKAN